MGMIEDAEELNSILPLAVGAYLEKGLIADHLKDKAEQIASNAIQEGTKLN